MENWSLKRLFKIIWVLLWGSHSRSHRQMSKPPKWIRIVVLDQDRLPVKHVSIVNGTDSYCADNLTGEIFVPHDWVDETLSVVYLPTKTAIQRCRPVPAPSGNYFVIIVPSGPEDWNQLSLH